MSSKPHLPAVGPQHGSMSSNWKDVVEYEQQQLHVQQQKLRLAAQDAAFDAQAHSSQTQRRSPQAQTQQRTPERKRMSRSVGAFRAYPSSPSRNEGSLLTQPAGPGSAAGALYGTSHGSSLQSLPDPAQLHAASGEHDDHVVPALVLGLTVLAVRDLAPPDLVRRAAQHGGTRQPKRSARGTQHRPPELPMSIAQGIMTVQSASLLPGVRVALLRAPCLRSAAKLAGAVAKLAAAPRLLPPGETSAVSSADEHTAEEGAQSAQFVHATASALECAVAAATQTPPPHMALLLDSRGDALASGAGMHDTGGTQAAAMSGLASLASQAADCFVEYAFDGVQAVHMLGAGGVPQHTLQDASSASGLLAFQVRTHGQGGAEWLGTAYLPLLAAATAPDGQLDTWLPMWAPGQAPDPTDVENLHPDWQQPDVCTGWLHVQCTLHLVSTACLGAEEGASPPWSNPHPDVTALTAQLAGMFQPVSSSGLVAAGSDWAGGGAAPPSPLPPAHAPRHTHTPATGRLPSAQHSTHRRPQSASMRTPARAVGHDAAAVLPQLAGSATSHQASVRAGHIYANRTHGTLALPKHTTRTPTRPSSAASRVQHPRSGAAALLALSPGKLQATASGERRETAELRQALKRAKTRNARLEAQLKSARQTALEVRELARLNAPHSSAGGRLRSLAAGGGEGGPHPVARTAIAASLAKDGMLDAAAVVTGNLTLGLAIPDEAYGRAAPGGEGRVRSAALQARAETLHKRLVAMAREKEHARSGRHEEQAAARASVLRALTLLHSVGVLAQREYWTLHARAAGDHGAEAQRSAQHALQAYGGVLDTLGSRLGVFVAAAPPDGLPAHSAFPSWLLAAEAAAIQDASHHLQVQADADTVCPPDLRAVYAPEVLHLAARVFPDILQDMPQLQRGGLSGQTQHTLDELQEELLELGGSQEELALRRSLLQQRLERSGQAAAAALRIDQGRLARMRSRLGTLREDLALVGRQEHAALVRLAGTVQEPMVQRGVAACHSGASGTRLPEGVPYHKPQAWSDTPHVLKGVLLAEIEGLKAAEREAQAQLHARRMRGIQGSAARGTGAAAR